MIGESSVVVADEFEEAEDIDQPVTKQSDHSPK